MHPGHRSMSNIVKASWMSQVPLGRGEVIGGVCCFRHPSGSLAGQASCQLAGTAARVRLPRLSFIVYVPASHACSRQNVFDTSDGQALLKKTLPTHLPKGALRAQRSWELTLLLAIINYWCCVEGCVFGSCQSLSLAFGSRGVARNARNLTSRKIPAPNP